jgi:hypothetical protein
LPAWADGIQTYGGVDIEDSAVRFGLSRTQKARFPQAALGAERTGINFFTVKKLRLNRQDGRARGFLSQDPCGFLTEHPAYRSAHGGTNHGTERAATDCCAAENYPFHGCPDLRVESPVYGTRASRMP